MKAYIIGIVISLLATFFAYYQYHQSINLYNRSVANHEKEVAYLKELIVSSDLNQLLHPTVDFGNDNNQVIKFRASLVAFQEAEQELYKLRQLIHLRGEGDPPPVVMNSFNLAVEKYNLAKELIDQCNLDEYSYFYIRGCIYFRQISLQKNKEEMIAKSLEAFKKALHKKPKDLATEVAIELLIKNGNGMGGDSSSQMPSNPKQMMQKPPGQSPPVGSY